MRRPILAALAALAAAAPASAATVSPKKVRSPQIAVNVDGATVVAWERLGSRGIAIEARAGDGPLELGRTRRLSLRGYAPRVAIGADGTSAVMWREDGARGVRSIRVAVARPGQGFGRGQLLYRRRALVTTVGLAVQPSGRVVAIWQRATGRLAYALARRNHGFGRGRNLGVIRQPAGGAIPVDPRDGSVSLAYGTPVGSSPPTNQQAAVRTLTLTGSTFSAPTVLSQGPGTTPFAEAYPTMVSGQAGVGVAYVQVGDPYSLNLVRRNGDGSWAPAERIAASYFGAADIFPSGLAATLLPDGSAVAAWSLDKQAPSGTIANQVVASNAAPSGPFGPFQALTPANGRVSAPAVASAGGEAFVATARTHGPVLLATRAAGAGAFAPPATLAERGDGDVLLAAAGAHVLAAYQQGDRLRLEVVR
jgi:hypothetical protein